MYDLGQFYSNNNRTTNIIRIYQYTNIPGSGVLREERVVRAPLARLHVVRVGAVDHPLRRVRPRRVVVACRAGRRRRVVLDACVCVLLRVAGLIRSGNGRGISSEGQPVKARKGIVGAGNTWL